MIRWATAVSRKRITYQSERIGTTTLRRAIVQNGFTDIATVIRRPWKQSLTCVISSVWWRMIWSHLKIRKRELSQDLLLARRGIEETKTWSALTHDTRPKPWDTQSVVILNEPHSTERNQSCHALTLLLDRLHWLFVQKGGKLQKLMEVGNFTGLDLGTLN